MGLREEGECRAARTGVASVCVSMLRAGMFHSQIQGGVHIISEPRNSV